MEFAGGVENGRELGGIVCATFSMAAHMRLDCIVKPNIIVQELALIYVVAQVICL